MSASIYRVSDRGQMALPADARRRWKLTDGGSVEIVVLVEDHLLLRMLLDDEPPTLRPAGAPMGELVHAGARLNLLSLEALAAARYLAADVCLAEIDNNAPLRAAATEFGISVRTISD